MCAFEKGIPFILFYSIADRSRLLGFHPAAESVDDEYNVPEAMRREGWAKIACAEVTVAGKCVLRLSISGDSITFSTVESCGVGILSPSKGPRGQHDGAQVQETPSTKQSSVSTRHSLLM